MSKKMIEKKEKKKKKVLLKDAKLSKRGISYLIDWYVGGLFTSLPIGLFSLKMYNTMLHQDIMNFPSPQGLLAGLAGLVGAIVYFFVIPAFVWKGQTFGKRVCHVRIVNMDDTEVSAKTLLLRQLVGVFLIEGGLVTASTILHQVFMLVTSINIVKPLMYVGLAISGVSALLVLFKNDHRAIHDYLAKTRVVEGNAE